MKLINPQQNWQHSTSKQNETAVSPHWNIITESLQAMVQLQTQ